MFERQEPQAIIKLPLFLTESLLPLRSGPRVQTRAYQDCFITIQGGTIKGKDALLPSGIIGRRLLFYFITQAHSQKSPVIEISGTQSLLTEIGISHKGTARHRVKRELVRLSKTFITIDRFPWSQAVKGTEIDSESFEGHNFRIMKGISLYNVDKPEQLNLFKSRVEFAPEFYDLLVQLYNHHPPIDKESLWAIDSPLATDVYCWLQRKVCSPRVVGSLELNWKVIYGQFGRGEQISKFKSAFRKAMKSASEQIKTYKTDPFTYDRPPIEETKSGIRINPQKQQVRELSKPKNSGWV